MAKIHINGTEYYYELSGRGDPVILIAGYTCDHTFWAPIIDRLRLNFHVLTFDNRGVGQTKDQREPLTAEMLADDVIALAKALEITRPHIVGHSMGGNIAQGIAARHPGKIHRLAILCSPPKWRRAMLLGTQSLLSMRQQNCSFHLIAEATFPWIFGEAFLQDRNTMEQLKTLALENPYPQSMEDQARQHRLMERFDGRNQLQAIVAPTLIVYGKQDLVFLPDEAKQFARQMPHAVLTELDCAHNLVAEVPEAFSNLLQNFLKP